MSEKVKNNMFKSASIMMILTLIGKMLGVYRDRLQGASFGTTSIEGMAFSFASQIPRNFLDIVFISAISGSFIPIFNSIYEKEGKENAFKLAYNFISIIILLSTIFTVICIIFSWQIMEIMTGNNLDMEVLILGASLLKAMLPLIVLSGVAFSMVGILQSMGEFGIPALMSVFQNVIIIVYYFFFLNKFGILGLCIAYLIGWASQIIIQIPFLVKNNYKFKIFINFKDKNIKEIAVLMIPVMISTWIVPINVLVNSRAVTVIGENGPGNLNAAYTLYSIIASVFIASISNVIFPTLSKQNVNEDKEGFGNTMSQTIRILFFIMIPMTFGMIGLSTPIVRFLYETGKFTKEMTEYTSTALRYFSLGVIGYGLQMILSRGFYAIKDGKTPAITSIVAICVNFMLSFILVKYIGIKGPALSSSISITVAGLLMLIKMYTLNNKIINKKTIVDIVKMIIIGIIMYFVVVLVVRIFNNYPINSISKILILIIPTCAGIVVYLILAYLLKLEEIIIVKNIIRKGK